MFCEPVRDRPAEMAALAVHEVEPALGGIRQPYRSRTWALRAPEA